jgi:hypothetical protein
MQSLNAPASSVLLSQTSSDIRLVDTNPALLSTDMQTADSETNIQSGSYDEVGTSGSTLKTHIISAGYCWTLYRCLFVSICQTAVGIISQVEVASHSISYGKFVTSQSSQ